MYDRREALLSFLRKPTGDAESDHAEAERLLLALVGDPEINQAWDDASQNWWYA